MRVETALYDGYRVPVHYDPLIAKLIVHADGRAATVIARAKAALREYVIDGIKTNIPLHLKILNDPDFQRGDFATDFLRRYRAGAGAGRSLRAVAGRSLLTEAPRPCLIDRLQRTTGTFIMISKQCQKLRAALTGLAAIAA